MKWSNYWQEGKDSHNCQLPCYCCMFHYYYLDGRVQCGVDVGFRYSPRGNPLVRHPGYVSCFDSLFVPRHQKVRLGSYWHDRWHHIGWFRRGLLPCNRGSNGHLSHGSMRHCDCPNCYDCRVLLHSQRSKAMGRGECRVGSPSAFYMGQCYLMGFAIAI